MKEVFILLLARELRIKFYLMLLFSLLMNENIYSQNVIDSLDNQNRVIMETLMGKSSFNKRITNEQNAALRLLNETSTELFKKLKEGGELHPLADSSYINSLKGSQFMFQTIGDSLVADETLYLEQIRAVEIDYRIKLNSSELGATSNIDKWVKVRAETLLPNGEKTEGYLVRGNPAWEFDNSDPQIFFNNPTNNAVMKLPPGYYWFWVEKDGNQYNKRRFEIGNLGEDEETITFIIK